MTSAQDELVPRHLAGIEVARRRVRRGGPGPVDDDLLLVRDLTVAGAAGPLRARRYVPRVGPRASVLYLHGGGWALGDLDINDGVCRHLAAAARVSVLSLDYRLAPEHPFPAALDDASAALAALAQRGLDGCPGPLAVAGLSAGGQLAAVLARRSRDGAAPGVVHQLLYCPVLDCDLARPSYREHGHGPGLSVDDMAWFWGMYVPEPAAREQPDASPLRARDLSRLPPTTVVVAGDDPLRDEGLEYAARLAAAGVDVRLQLVPDAPHAVVAIHGAPGGAAALRASSDHLNATLDALDAAGDVASRRGPVNVPEEQS